MRAALVISALLAAVPLLAQQAPTPAEMAFIYELNRARNDPQRYDQENGLAGLLNGVAAQPPLAVNNNLVQSARFHSDEMATYGYFAHTSPITGDQPNRMAIDAGYPLPWTPNANYIESLACVFSSGNSISYNGAEALRALIIDAGVTPPGHRIHLLAMESFYQAHREIGTGYAEGLAPTMSHPGNWQAGAYWSIHTARRSSEQFWLTGVVYDDLNSNGRYDQGEGIAGATVSVTGASTGSAVTNPGGGWSIAVNSGAHTVHCSGGAYPGTAFVDLNVGTANVAVDFVAGDEGALVNFEYVPGGGTAPPPGGGNPPPGGNQQDPAEGTTDTSSSGGCTIRPSGGPVLLLALLLAGVLRNRKLRLASVRD